METLKKNKNKLRRIGFLGLVTMLLFAVVLSLSLAPQVAEAAVSPASLVVASSGASIAAGQVNNTAAGANALGGSGLTVQATGTEAWSATLKGVFKGNTKVEYAFGGANSATPANNTNHNKGNVSFIIADAINPSNYFSMHINKPGSWHANTVHVDYNGLARGAYYDNTKTGKYDYTKVSVTEAYGRPDISDITNPEHCNGKSYMDGIVDFNASAWSNFSIEWDGDILVVSYHNFVLARFDGTSSVKDGTADGDSGVLANITKLPEYGLPKLPNFATNGYTVSVNYSAKPAGQNEYGNRVIFKSVTNQYDNGGLARSIASDTAIDEPIWYENYQTANFINPLVEPETEWDSVSGDYTIPLVEYFSYASVSTPYPFTGTAKAGDCTIELTKVGGGFAPVTEAGDYALSPGNYTLKYTMGTAGTMTYLVKVFVSVDAESLVVASSGASIAAGQINNTAAGANALGGSGLTVQGTGTEAWSATLKGVFKGNTEVEYAFGGANSATPANNTNHNKGNVSFIIADAINPESFFAIHINIPDIWRANTVHVDYNGLARGAYYDNTKTGKYDYTKVSVTEDYGRPDVAGTTNGKSYMDWEAYPGIVDFNASAWSNFSIEWDGDILVVSYHNFVLARFDGTSSVQDGIANGDSGVLANITKLPEYGLPKLPNFAANGYTVSVAYSAKPAGQNEYGDRVIFKSIIADDVSGYYTTALDGFSTEKPEWYENWQTANFINPLVEPDTEWDSVSGDYTIPLVEYFSYASVTTPYPFTGTTEVGYCTIELTKVGGGFTPITEAGDYALPIGNYTLKYSIGTTVALTYNIRIINGVSLENLIITSEASVTAGKTVGSVTGLAVQATGTSDWSMMFKGIFNGNTTVGYTLGGSTGGQHPRSNMSFIIADAANSANYFEIHMVTDPSVNTWGTTSVHVDYNGQVRGVYNKGIASSFDNDYTKVSTSEGANNYTGAENCIGQSVFGSSLTAENWQDFSLNWEGDVLVVSYGGVVLARFDGTAEIKDGVLRSGGNSSVYADLDILPEYGLPKLPDFAANGYTISVKAMGTGSNEAYSNAVIFRDITTDGIDGSYYSDLSGAKIQSPDWLVANKYPVITIGGTEFHHRNNYSMSFTYGTASPLPVITAADDFAGDVTDSLMIEYDFSFLGSSSGSVQLSNQGQVSDLISLLSTLPANQSAQFYTVYLNAGAGVGATFVELRFHISPKTLTFNSDVIKEFDGLLTAPLSMADFDGIFPTDIGLLDGEFFYAQSGVGTDIAITGFLTGSAAGNYMLPSLTGSITRASIVITATTEQNTVYSGLPIAVSYEISPSERAPSVIAVYYLSETDRASNVNALVGTPTFPGTYYVTILCEDTNYYAEPQFVTFTVTGQPFTVTIKIADKIEDITLTVNYGETVDISQIMRKGYKLEGLYTNEEHDAIFDSNIAITGDVTLYAQWTKTGGGGSAAIIAVASVLGVLTLGVILTFVLKRKFK